jgi:hypothetical protein
MPSLMIRAFDGTRIMAEYAALVVSSANVQLSNLGYYGCLLSAMRLLKC